MPSVDWSSWPVTIGLSSDDTGEGTVSPSSVTFTTGNWDSARTVTVTGVNAMLGRVQVNTLGGDDTLTVDETGGLITPLIGYDGGTGSDLLNVTGTTAVTDVQWPRRVCRYRPDSANG